MKKSMKELLTLVGVGLILFAFYEFANGLPAGLWLTPGEGGGSKFEFAVSVSPLTQIYSSPYKVAMIYTLTVSVIVGSPKPVVVRWFGLMKGAIAEFNQGTFNPPFSKTATIYPSDITPAGTYSLTVTCSSEGLVHSKSVTLIVTH